MLSDKWNGASLVLVVVENCLDRHTEENGERVALIREKDRLREHEPVTYWYVWVVHGGWGFWSTLLPVFVCPYTWVVCSCATPFWSSAECGK